MYTVHKLKLSLDQAGPLDFQEFSNMQHCPSRVLPTMEPPATHHVYVNVSLHAFYRYYSLRLTLYTGTETIMIRASLARYIGAKVTKSTQTTLQADSRTL